uniref:Ribokinase n=2 Tax=Globodera pallida TaxID=36090 RepID=A0A183CPB9_GLOPA
MAARLGTRVSMVGMVGDDLFADENLRSIAQNGVDVSLVQQLAGQTTGTATITVSADGENCIVVSLGANNALGVERAHAVEQAVARARLVLCQQEIDQAGTLTLFRIAKRHGVTTFFNPAPGRADIDLTILPLCDIICTNENEAEFLTHLPMDTVEQAKLAALRILELGPRVAIVTLGPKGAIVAQRGTNNGHVNIGEVLAPKVTAVDTTGAGDCFCGALAHFLVAQPSAELLEDHVRRAVQIAALSVQKKGAQARDRSFFKSSSAVNGAVVTNGKCCGERTSAPSLTTNSGTSPKKSTAMRRSFFQTHNKDNNTRFSRIPIFNRKNVVTIRSRTPSPPATTTPTTMTMVVAHCADAATQTAQKCQQQPHVLSSFRSNDKTAPRDSSRSPLPTQVGQDYVSTIELSKKYGGAGGGGDQRGWPLNSAAASCLDRK